MDEKGHISQTDDNSQKADGAGAANVKIDLHLPKDSFWKQPAIYVSILALIIALGGEWRRWVALDDDKHSNAMWMALVYTEYDAAKSKLDAQGIHLKNLPPPPQ